MRHWMPHFIQMPLPAGQTSKLSQKNTTVAKFSCYPVRWHCHAQLLFPNTILLSMWTFAEVAALKVFFNGAHGYRAQDATFIKMI